MKYEDEIYYHQQGDGHMKYNIEQMHKLPTCDFFSQDSINCSDSVDSPLQLKLINYLGLKQYMIDKFIFKRKPSKYFIRKKDNTNTLFNETQYTPPYGYTYETKILQTPGHSVPILHLRPNNKISENVIVYAHGNASDLADSLAFVDKLSHHIESEYVVFDYTGYGQSRVSDVGEEIICQDIEIVLAWITTTHALNEIILWGFSLGTFPVLYAASQYQVKGVILQCPIASVACIFQKELNPNAEFEDDYFSNLKLITKVRSKIFITHSSGDEIIPFSHAKVLFDKFVKKRGIEKITLIQIGRLKHNALHRYIAADTQNQLQKQVFEFILGLFHDNPKKNKAELKQSTSSQTQCGQQSEYNLKKIRKNIKEAEISELMGDMDEIIIVENENNVTAIHRLKSDKACLCFTHQD